MEEIKPAPERPITPQPTQSFGNNRGIRPRGQSEMCGYDTHFLHPMTIVALSPLIHAMDTYNSRGQNPEC